MWVLSRNPEIQEVSTRKLAAQPGRFFAYVNGMASSEPLPSGKLSHIYGKSLFLMGQLTISMAIFNSYVSWPEGIQNFMVSEINRGTKMKVRKTNFKPDLNQECWPFFSVRWVSL